MAIKGLQKLHLLSDSYAAYRDDQIKVWENELLKGGNLTKLNAHVDVISNSIAVGYGYDLKANLKTFKTELANYVTPSSNLAMVYKLVDDYFNKGNPSGYGSLQKLADAINQCFDFGTLDNATKLVDKKIKECEAKLDTRLGYKMDDSMERAALISMIYNGGIGLIGDKLTGALQNDNRAEAWYEIRYESCYATDTNGVKRKVKGLANRRYEESGIFGLYDNGTPPITDPDEAKEVMRMYTMHQLLETDPKRTIKAHESAFPPGSADIGLWISRAQSYLTDKFAPGVQIDGFVLVGRGLTSYEYLENSNYADRLGGSNQNDLMFGERGNDLLIGWAGRDVIYGGEGNDIIIGDTGDDTLYGGQGDDTYYINTGDGTDRIEDKEHGKRGDIVVMNTTPLEPFVRKADGTFENLAIELAPNK